jgi:hypothetical protein
MTRLTQTFRLHGCEFAIWSFKHRAWWRANQLGYTEVLEQAGFYPLEKAIEICARANIDGPNEVIVPVPRLRGLRASGPEVEPDCGDADERGADGKRNADRK